MPTLEKESGRQYRRFGWSIERSEHTGVEGLGRAHRSVCERGQTVPKDWFVVRGPLPKRGEWRTTAHWSKEIMGDWLKRSPSERRRTSQTQSRIPQNIAEAIISSRGILDLSENWDDQGSSGYEEDTWRRACDFLVRHADFARESLGRDLPVPRILPGPQGSIDVHWKMPRFELLVNIPKDASKPATFYGDDFGKSSIRGNLNPAEAIPGLIVWLLT